MSKPMNALIILDGFGERECRDNNAIAMAKTPNMDMLKKNYPYTTLGASGLDVGLPEGQMGNSEVGHLNIGAGRIVYQKFTGINMTIEKGAFYHNEAFLSAVENCKKNNSKLHLMGLVSDGGVHSHNTHLYALIKFAKENGLTNVFIHCFMDGRDVPPASGRDYIIELEEEIEKMGFGTIATVMGRYYAMDRDNRWERVQKAYDAMRLGLGVAVVSATQAIENSYAQDVVDEFVLPSVVMQGDKPVATVSKNDSIIFFNFRPDRAREITRAFIEPEFSGFVRENGYVPVCFVCLTPYDDTFNNVQVAYSEEEIEQFLPEQKRGNGLGEYLASLGLKQLRIAETEKYAHVTFFFNGGVEIPSEGEERVLIPSPKIATYDLKPEMSAYEVADEAVRRIESGKYDVMILNFANADMVGHTGVLSAAIKAVQAVDECVGKVVQAILKTGGRAIVTADHGNAEKMLNVKTGEPFTAHTTDRVPCIIVDEKHKNVKLTKCGRLADLAPTLLELMGLCKPIEMTGTSLLIKP